MKTSAEELRRTRPRSRLLRTAAWATAALVVFSWMGGDFGLEQLSGERRLANLERFTGELRPWPVQQQGGFDAGSTADWQTVYDWAAALMADGGSTALASTAAIAVLASVLAALVGYLACWPAARNVARPAPFFGGPGVADRRPGLRWTRWAWSVLNHSVRALLLFARAVPEYLWAFLLVESLGYTALPAVLALALHNAGILGRLGAETVENMPPAPARALAAAGASRSQAAAAVFPGLLPRLLLYFFYRWETCVREATVLGMLGVLSLGSLIRDARAGNLYDELFFYVLLGALLVLAGDLLSALARGLVRRA
jgi:phosphonate transport system permease protein